MSRYLVLNFVFFQLLWFGCVLAAGAWQWHLAAMAASLPLIALSWFSNCRMLDWRVAAIAVIVGVLMDNLWVYLDILTYPRNALAPYWIGVLWMGVGLTVNHSLAWFRDKPTLGPMIAGLFAPITYLAGERFGAVDIANVHATAIIVVAWVTLFFWLFRYARNT